jgi:hypothetical protein
LGVCTEREVTTLEAPLVGVILLPFVVTAAVPPDNPYMVPATTAVAAGLLTPDGVGVNTSFLLRPIECTSVRQQPLLKVCTEPLPNSHPGDTTDLSVVSPGCELVIIVLTRLLYNYNIRYKLIIKQLQFFNNFIFVFNNFILIFNKFLL